MQVQVGQSRGRGADGWAGALAETGRGSGYITVATW